MCRWSLKLIFKAKVKLESGNQKIQYGRQAAILKVTSLKINRLLPMATINMHMKFEIEIPKQTWLMLRKPCRLQTDRRTDGQTDKVNPVYPPSNFVGRGYKKPVIVFCGHPSWRSAIRGALQLKSLCQNHHVALNSTGFSQPRRVPPLCVQGTILNLGQPGRELDRILWVQPLI